MTENVVGILKCAHAFVRLKLMTSQFLDETFKMSTLSEKKCANKWGEVIGSYLTVFVNKVVSTIALSTHFQDIIRSIL